LHTFDKLADREYWKHIRELWTHSEERSGTSPWLISLLKAPRGERDVLMTSEEHATLAALPDRGTLYRGITFFPGDPLKYARGMSWTNDLGMAAYFAHPSGWLAGGVLTAEVPRWRVLAYFQERGECEVVIDPRRISYRVHPMPIEEALDLSADALGRLEEHVDGQLRRDKETRDAWDAALLRDPFSAKAIGTDRSRLSI
jgi:hypothetical protein